MADVGQGLIDGAQLVGGLMQHSKTAQDFIDAQYDHAAKVKAGGLISAGDNAGAAAVLGSRGLLPETQALQGAANDQTTLTALNNNDYAAARTSAAKSGDPAMYGKVASMQQTEQAQRAQWLGNAADALIGIKGADPATTETARHAAFLEHVAPVLKQMGVPDDQIAEINAGHMSDEALNSFKVTLGQMDKMTIQTDPETGEVSGINPTTGEVRLLRKGTPKPLILGDGQEAHDPVDGHVIAKAGSKTQYKTITNADGTTSLVEIGGDKPASPPLKSGFDNFYHAFVAPHEGGYTPSDGNGQPANFGINQGANPDLDVKNMSQADAQKVLHDRYWVPSGADKIQDPALAAIQGDTAINMGVAAANSLLQQSGGDPQKYLQLREARYKAIAAANPAKAASLPVWLARNQDLASYVGGGGDNSSGGPQVVAKGVALGVGTGGLTPAAIDQAARRFAITGQLPTTGMGKTGAADKEAIQNRAAEITSGDPNIVEKAANYKADAAALAKNQAIRQYMEGAEKAALDTMDLAITEAKKGSAAPNIPFASGAIQTGLINGTHSPGRTQLRNYIGDANTEIAKVLSGGTGSASPTVEAQREARTRFNEGMPLEQLIAARDATAAVMAKRVAAQRGQEDVIQQRLKSYLPSATATPAPATKTVAEAKAPAVGAVQGGYRFKGGDPASQANWTKVQ